MTTLSNDANNHLSPELWEQFTFEGKEFCALNEAGELVLKGHDHCPERKLSVLHADSYESVVHALAEKFKEVTAKLTELHTEWEQAEDKLKVAGKVWRTKDYLDRASAVGNYLPFYQDLKEKQDFIREQYEQNYAAKVKLVEAAEQLKDSDDWKAATEAYRQLQEDWKNSAPVERERNDQLWERIDAARNHFYERKRQHHEEVEQDMMQNMDLKMELCEKAEALAHSEEWRKTSDIHKELMEQWKKIGKVASHEKSEELWQRFVSARNTFFERKKAHYDTIQQEQESNYAAKLVLVERSEALAGSTDWKETAQEMGAIMDQWKTIGRVPAEQADALWTRLQAARDVFFGAKRQHAEEFKVSLEDNYAQKLALMNRAEALKGSTSWRESTDELNELMVEWKKIGHIPREYGDEAWERFIAARKYFFERKDADREKRKARFQSQVESRYQQTRQFLDKIRTELAEEEDKLEEFKASLLQLHPETGGKELELKTHLENLIRQIEEKLPGRREKVAEVEQQLAELEQKHN